MKNSDLKDFYNKIYSKGEKNHYTKLLFREKKITLEKLFILAELSFWRGKNVLDAGCGTGELAFLIAKKGAKKVVGVDFSSSAIEAANQNYQQPNLEYQCQDLKNIKEHFDVVVSAGTLEHIENPYAVLKKLKSLLNPGGSLIITVPNWINPRGYILMTLRYLFKARITLADLHYFTPYEFENWAKKLKMKLTWKTFEHDWSGGEKLIKDMERRLPRVLHDSIFPQARKNTKDFVNWLKDHAKTFPPDKKFGGAVAIYHFKK